MLEAYPIKAFSCHIQCIIIDHTTVLKVSQADIQKKCGWLSVTSGWLLDSRGWH